MPAERTRSAKKEEGSGIQLTWTAPIEPTAQSGIAFAPNVTPGTFTEPSPPVEPETLPALFPDGTEDPTPRRPGHGKKKPEDHIPRPPNAFILFRSSFIKSQHVTSEVETNHSTLSKIIGITWQNMPHNEREFWHTKARVAQAEHKKKWPDYAFRPHHMRGKGGTEKRKVREVGPKDPKRCQKIADLLVEGKKGADLEAAIQEFDRHHVAPVITRFETPLTARMFRRSSSEPAPDTEPSAPAFLRSTPKSSRRLRAVSTQPSSRSASAKRRPEVKPEASSSSPETTPSQDDDVDDSMPPLVLPPMSLDMDFTFTAKQYPSFDLNTFVFSDSPAPAQYIDTCDPLTPISPTDVGSPFAPTELHSPSHSQHPAYATPSPSFSGSFYGDWHDPSFSDLSSTSQDYPSQGSSFDPAACKPYDMPPIFEHTAYNGDMLQPHYPMGLADAGNLPPLANHTPEPTSFPSYDGLCPPAPPSKGRFAYPTHKSDAHLEVSLSDYLAQPIPNYTI